MKLRILLLTAATALSTVTLTVAPSPASAKNIFPTKNCKNSYKCINRFLTKCARRGGDGTWHLGSPNGYDVSCAY
ncbi:MAG: hypothetical protein JWM47_1040 [Acidimicrobiales bacterium]|nr:hypothetical protein [Acidimicrobiales bacterium]